MARFFEQQMWQLRSWNCHIVHNGVGSASTRLLFDKNRRDRFLIPPAINVDISRKYYENKN